MKAATIVAAQFVQRDGLSAPELKGHDPTQFTIGWQNDRLPEGQAVFLGYGLGTHGKAGAPFTFLRYPFDGVFYIWGSEIITLTPGMGSGNTEPVKGYAPPAIEVPVNWDAYCFIATGSLGILTADFGHGRRIIGLKIDDFEGLSFIADALFPDVFTQVP